jgi:hypothetical protein
VVIFHFHLEAVKRISYQNPKNNTSVQNQIPDKNTWFLCVFLTLMKSCRSVPQGSAQWRDERAGAPATGAPCARSGTAPL